MTTRERLNWDPERGDIGTMLADASVEDCKLLPIGSNYVFLLSLKHPAHGSGLAIYKPEQGAAPLWDFPNGTLYRRERAAYLLSRELGWHFVPPTIVRDGPYGIGMVQLYIPNDPRVNFFTLRDEHEPAMRQIALFDVVANNADRKGGHCLRGPDGRIWGIDHGLTFHESNKLRTVIWDYSGEPVDRELIADLQRLSVRLRGETSIHEALNELLDGTEVEALRQRVARLIRKPQYPKPGLYRSVPWPPV